MEHPSHRSDRGCTPVRRREAGVHPPAPTGDGTFWVENGKIKHGIKNLRFTASMLKALSNVQQISQERKIVASWWEDVGCIVARAMLIDNFKFTGKTEF
jgi:hypothetical protein